MEFRKFDIKAPVRRIYPGKKQPYRAFLDKIRRRLIEMGFIEMTVDSLIETQFWNFDALFQPQNHPAREWTDTYQLKYPKVGSCRTRSLSQGLKPLTSTAAILAQGVGLRLVAGEGDAPYASCPWNCTRRQTAREGR